MPSAKSKKIAEDYAFRLLSLMPYLGLKYHNREHSVSVYNAVKVICKGEKIDKKTTELLQTAALYHDLGYIVQYADNEEVGAEIADTALGIFGFSRKERNLIRKAILATKVPQRPRNRLEEIICDADIAKENLALIKKTAEALRLERGVVDKKRWNAMQLVFFKSHRYFTKTARRLYQPSKELYMRELDV